MRYIASPVHAAIAATCLFGTLSPAHATADMALNTSGFVAGQPSTLSVDGVITGTSSPLVITGACVELRFDPTKVTISNLRTDSSTGWELLAYNTDNTADGWIRTAMFNNLNPGQTTTGPILLFTVTPANSTVNVNDCDTLRFSGSESDFCDDGFYDYIPSDPCEGIYAPSGGPDEPSRMNGHSLDAMLSTTGGPPPEPPVQQQIMSTSFGGSMNETVIGIPSGPFAASASSLGGCVEDFVAAGNALRIAGGLAADRPQDVDFYDRDGDHKITLIDAVMILRDPCPAPTRWWEIGFTNAMCSNPPAFADIDRDIHGYEELVFSSDYQNPLQYNADPYRTGNPQQIWAVRDTDGNGNYGILTGWPRPLRDAPNGIALANFAGNRAAPNNPWTVFGINFQDSHGQGNEYIYSHLWAWTANGGPVDVDNDGVQDFANERAPDLPTGLGVGHSNAAPAVFDINNDGIPEAFFHFQGQLLPGEYDYVGGGLKAYAPHIVDSGATEPTLVFQTSSNPNNEWYVSSTEALFDNPPVFPNLNPNDDTPTVTRNVVSATEKGYLYGWNADGSPAPGWEPKARADQYTFDGVSSPTYTDFFEFVATGPQGGQTIRDPATVPNPIAAGNVDGQPGDEVIAASGDARHYWGFCRDADDVTHVCLRAYPLYTLDGAVYCWNTNGSLRWRYPAYVPGQRLQTFLPAFTSGVSLGHLNGPTGPVAAVVGNVNGEVYALNASTGALMWKFQTHAPVHIAYRQIRAEPLIFDVNGDGIQDVVVGTSDGYVYALRGNPTNVNGEELWHTRTFGGVPDSVWPDSQGRLVRESHYEEVRGMGVGNLYGSDRTHATIAVCSSALQESGASPLTGHLLILDLGPGTWSANAADWPQWQRTAQRTGTLGVQ